MYRECAQCATKNFPTKTFDAGRMVEWSEWKTKTVDYQKDTGKDKIEHKRVSMTVKEVEKGTLQRLVDEFQEDLKGCCKHLYNIRHQFSAIRTLKGKLSEGDVLVHVDFSENFNCKCSTEIQSMHFGASQRQITLYTGVIYMKGKTIPFCPMSDCLKHEPAAIWAHLLPVMKMAKDYNSSISNLYFLSDGPTTQYRCKENFYLLSNIPFELGFKMVNWNFTEAGHGKGAHDGIAAVITRKADRGVSHGLDIMDAKSMYDNFMKNELSVKLFLVTEDEVTATAEKLHDVRTVKGTMKIHQIFSTQPSEMWFRNVSCFCKSPEACQCYAPIRTTFSSSLPQKQKNATTNGRKTTRSRNIDPELVVFDSSLEGRYCVVTYDGKPFPGVIYDVDDEQLEVIVTLLVTIGSFGR